MDSTAMFGVDTGFYAGIRLWGLLESLILWDPCPFAFPGVLTVAHIVTAAALATWPETGLQPETHGKTNYALRSTRPLQSI